MTSRNLTVAARLSAMRASVAAHSHGGGGGPLEPEGIRTQACSESSSGQLASGVTLGDMGVE